MREIFRVRGRRIAAAVVASALVLGTIGLAWASESRAEDDRLADLARREKDLRDTNVLLERHYQGLAAKVSDLRVREEQVRASNVALAAQADGLADDVEKARNDAAALTASNAALVKEQRKLAAQVDQAKADADAAVCRATWEQFRAHTWEINAQYVAARAGYYECVAQVKQADSEQTGLGCVIGILAGGVGGAVLCGGAMALGDEVQSRCGVEPMPISAEAMQSAALAQMGLQAEPSCFAEYREQLR
jgi:hypothetical protein